MIKVKQIKNTCRACPSQWEGITEDNHTIYVRYRWGHLSIKISSEESNDVMDAVEGKEIISLETGDNMDGTMAYDELKQYVGLINGKIELPEKETL